MSGANRGQSTAAGDYSQENMLSRLRSSLKPRAAANENQENLPPKHASNRTVLGALQNNQRSKGQSQRGTKQVGPRCWLQLLGSSSTRCLCLFWGRTFSLFVSFLISSAVILDCCGHFCLTRSHPTLTSYVVRHLIVINHLLPKETLQH